MDKYSSYWFPALYTIAMACYLVITNPTMHSAIALFGGAMAAIVLNTLFYILK